LLHLLHLLLLLLLCRYCFGLSLSWSSSSCLYCQDVAQAIILLSWSFARDRRCYCICCIFCC
jgi:hypothetical protein